VSSLVLWLFVFSSVFVSVAFFSLSFVKCCWFFLFFLLFLFLFISLLFLPACFCDCWLLFLYLFFCVALLLLNLFYVNFATILMFFL